MKARLNEEFKAKVNSLTTFEIDEIVSTLETIAKSLEYCVEAVVNNTEDVKEVMGTTH